MKLATDIEALPSPPGPDRSWGGVDMLIGGKGYAPTPLGQVHYRDIGPRDSRVTILLMHQSPVSMVEFGAVQNSLARLGIRSIATDTPGYGMSDQPAILPSIGGLADNFIAVLDHLGLATVVAAGHHTGACIATAMAVRHPDRIIGLISNGTPLYTDEERERFIGHKEWDRSAKSDGSHLGQLFRWREGVELTDAQKFTRTWMSVMMFLQGPDIGHWAVNRYDMLSDWKAVSCPAMILTESEDVTHHMDKYAHEVRPDFAFRVHGEAGSNLLMTDPDGWAKIAAEFVATSVA